MVPLSGADLALRGCTWGPGQGTRGPRRVDLPVVSPLFPLRFRVTLGTVGVHSRCSGALVCRAGGRVLFEFGACRWVGRWAQGQAGGPWSACAGCGVSEPCVAEIHPPCCPHSLETLLREFASEEPFRLLRTVCLGLPCWAGDGGRTAGSRAVLTPRVSRQSAACPPLASPVGRGPRPEVGRGLLGSLLWTLRKRQLPESSPPPVPPEGVSGARWGLFRGEPGPPPTHPSSPPHPALPPLSSCLPPTL